MKSTCTFVLGAPLSQNPTPLLQWIEVTSSLQIPAFLIIGLPGPEVSEARERVRAAIESSGFEFPRRRVVLNLSPASVKKQGTGLDLAMALAILHHASPPRGRDTRNLPFRRVLAWGELGLDGTLKPAGNEMRTLYSACLEQVDCVILPDLSRTEEAMKLLRVAGIAGRREPQIFQAQSLTEAWEILQTLERGEIPGRAVVTFSEKDRAESEKKQDELVLSQPLMPIRASLERILGISASGGHHLLLLGSKGTGKSHALEWLSVIQPPTSSETRIMQILLSELNPPESGAPPLQHTQRAPIRRIGASARPGALLGSTSALSLRAGEYSLSHGGLLIADEFPEWARDSRESLREPLERGKVTLSRVRGTLELPASFTLAANGNLCPCGGVLENPGQETSQRCRCLPYKRLEYLNRLSGPVLDRIDLVVKLMNEAAHPGSGSSHTPQSLREQVLRSREQALKIYGKPPGLLQGEELEQLLRAHPDWGKHLDSLGTSSLRSRHKTLRVALSLALWDVLPPGYAHFVEAASYRHERLFQTH